ncbi:unnamed protein product, partial [Arabidopsis halleri]
MNSIDYPPPSLVICPFRRLISAERGRGKRTEISGSSFFIIDNSYHISDSDDAEDETHQIRLLLGCNNEEGEHYCSACHNNHKSVCGRKINENYGEYSCTKGCVYAVHSKCATRLDIWDGKELEDQPETLDDNIKSFEEIDDGIIRHFSHAHHLMRLHENIERFFDGEQNCQACILPLDDGNV